MQVHWMSSTSHEDGVLLELIELDHLITKKKIDEVCALVPHVLQLYLQAALTPRLLFRART
jgi:hypothetical protein